MQRRVVTPLVGVWIEIFDICLILSVFVVTPLVGVWIEISLLHVGTLTFTSLPLWECGLKYCEYVSSSNQC